MKSRLFAASLTVLWALPVTAQDDRVTLFRPLRCGNVRPGVRPPAPTAGRALAWLDGFGRVSPRYRVP